MLATTRTRVAALALALPLMTGCGFDVATDQVYTPAVGMNDRSGEVDVLNALIVADGEGSGVFVAGLSNNDEDNPDELTGVQVEGAEVGETAPVEIAQGGYVNLATIDAPIVVSGEAVESGRFVRAALQFANAEAITIRIPVVAQSGPYADITVPEASPSASPTP
ncbi:hypothetical protein GCM10027425_19020 [Alteromonas gracilis]